MISPVELRSVSAFAGLPDEQIDWFLSHLGEVCVKSGEAFVRQGDPAEWMFIFLEGQFQWRGEFGGDRVSLPAKAGEVSGVLPFSRMTRFTVTGKALTDGRVGKFSTAHFPELIQRMPELTTRLVATMSERIKEGTRIEQLRDRLTSLGKLSAGLAHELNNPASAAKRAADQARELLAKLRIANSELCRRPVSDADIILIEEAENSLLHSKPTMLDGLALSDLEENLDSILRRHGLNESFDSAAGLAKCNMPADTLTSLLENLNSGTARAAISRIAATAELSILLSTIENSCARISKLVGTVKDYTYMDEAPIQNIDVARSLDVTLSTLSHVLKPGIDVKRMYEASPVVVSAPGAELNQVWTNLVENAIDAMRGQGELRLRTSCDDNYAVIEIGDTGCGVPAEIRPYIFDPFFTTKDVGEGLGLGLNTVRTIVRKLGGNIEVDSKPGDTRFQVWIPRVDRTQLSLPTD